MSIGFFFDASLTQQVSSPLVATQNSDGSTGPVIFHLWIGDPESGWAYQADSNPSVDQITLSVTDTNPGSGHEATEISLATTQSGLASATPGADLQIGSVLLSGNTNAVEFWVSVNDATGQAGTSTELGITANLLRKVQL